MNQRGVTLIELIVAVILIAIVAMSMGLFFPKSTQALAQTRRRWEATNLANSLMQSIQSQPYPLILVTPANQFPGIPPKCDCQPSALAFSQISPYASIPTVIVDGMTYTQRVCVNFVQPSSTGGTPWCPSDTLTYPKNIRVSVSWPMGGNTENIDLESVTQGANE